MTAYSIHDLYSEINVTEPAALSYVPFGRRRQRVHILALGDVGTTMLLGLRLLGGDVISELGICDINKANVRRLEMEMNQICYPFAGQPGQTSPFLPPVRIVEEDQLFQCDVFIFCASKGVPPVGADGDVRMAQFEANRTLAAYFARLAGRAGFSGQVCIVSDPVDPLCSVFLQESGLQPSQIQGYGLGVMNARACYYATLYPETYGCYISEGRVFGPHGEDLIVADSIVNYGDKPSRALTKLVVEANRAVRNLGYKPYIAPALSSAALSILLTLRGQWHYSSIYFGDGQKGAFFGLKNTMTHSGIVYEDLSVCSALYERMRHAYLTLCQLAQ